MHMTQKRSKGEASRVFPPAPPKITYKGVQNIGLATGDNYPCYATDMTIQCEQHNKILFRFFTNVHTHMTYNTLLIYEHAIQHKMCLGGKIIQIC